MSPLTDTEREMLQLEAQRWEFEGAKVQAIRDRFGMSGTRFYQQINVLIDTEAALAFDPILVKRRRGQRELLRRRSSVPAVPRGDV